LRPGGDARGAPIVVFTIDTPDGPEIVRHGTPEAADIGQLWTQAKANLTALAYEWDFTLDGGLAIASCAGHDYSAEKVLDPAALKEAHRLLGVRRMLVAVPRRTCLYAVREDLTRAQRAAFEQVVKRVYQHDPAAGLRIAPGAFIVDGDQITGYTVVG
jgi:hypothetical protein